MAYNEPRQTLSKKDCNCDTCGKEIKKGTPCSVDPKNKKVTHVKCVKK